MKSRVKVVMHFAVLEIELLVLLVVVAFQALIQFKPTGIMTSAEGDVLRYRFAAGQDELLSRCGQVQIAFVTKQVSKAFSDPKLVIRDPLTSENRYAWHVIKAPIGTTAFRFDIQWKKEAQPSRTGPEVGEMWLGKKRIAWAEMKSAYEVYEPLTIPCYWFRHEYFFNLDRFDFLKFFFCYLIALNALLLTGFFMYTRKKR